MDIVLFLILTGFILMILYYSVLAFIEIAKFILNFLFWLFTRRLVLAVLFAFLGNLLLIIMFNKHLLCFISKDFCCDFYSSVFWSTIGIYFILPKDIVRLLAVLKEKFLTSDCEKLKKQYAYNVIYREFEKIINNFNIPLYKVNGLVLRISVDKDFDVFSYEDGYIDAISNFSEELVKIWKKNGSNLTFEQLEEMQLYMEIYYENDVKKAKINKISHLLYEIDGLC